MASGADAGDDIHRQFHVVGGIAVCHNPAGTQSGYKHDERVSEPVAVDVHVFFRAQGELGPHSENT